MLVSRPYRPRKAAAAGRLPNQNGSTPAEELPAGHKIQRKSGYVHYMDQHRAQTKLLLQDDTEMNAVQKNQKIMSLLAKGWRELSKDEQQKWKDEAPWHAVKIRAKKPKRAGAAWYFLSLCARHLGGRRAEDSPRRASRSMP